MEPNVGFDEIFPPIIVFLCQKNLVCGPRILNLPPPNERRRTLGANNIND